MTATPVLLDADAAATCPVKTQNAFNPLMELPSPGPNDATAVDETTAFRDQVWAELVRVGAVAPSGLRCGTVSGTTPHQAPDRAGAIAADADAMAAGVPIIVHAALPDDPAGHRCGTADVLVRGPDTGDGQPGYYPAIITAASPYLGPSRRRGEQLVSPLDRPRLDQAHVALGWHVDPDHAATPLLTLAHLWRLLQRAGHAASGPAWGAIIGPARTASTETEGDLVYPLELAWIALGDKQVRTFAATSSTGWKRRSALERYDHEHRFRLRVANHARRQTGAADDPPLAVAPVETPECATCPWRSTCIDPRTADLTAHVRRSPLDVREVMALRALGVRTIGDLAQSDVDALLGPYLPHVAHRSGAEARLRLAARRSQLTAAGIDLERLTRGRIPLPQADIEIDLDIESSAQNRVYLWGFLIDDRREPGSTPTYHPVVRFDVLGHADELDLAEEAATWLRDRLAALEPASSLVWHYSPFESGVIHRFARPRPGRTSPGLTWFDSYARTHFVDLLPIVKRHLFGVNGLGLKSVATAGPGFTWRDPEPSGLNSQAWFASAVGAPTDEAGQKHRQRVLEYNEDDVRATWAVRQWLRSLT